MKITPIQFDLLRKIVAGGGVMSAPSPSASDTYQDLVSLESLGLLANRGQVVWEVTPRGLRASKVNIPLVQSAPEPNGQCIIVQGQRVAPGDEILISGKRGRFRFKCADVTSEGRTVVNTIGPVGFHQAFRNFYIEDVRLLPVPKPRRKRRVV